MSYMNDDKLQTELKMLRGLLVDLVEAMPDDGRTRFLEKLDERIRRQEQTLADLNQPQEPVFQQSVSFQMPSQAPRAYREAEANHQRDLLRYLRKAMAG